MGQMTKRPLIGEMRTNPVVRPQCCGPVLTITDTNYLPHNFKRAYAQHAQHEILLVCL
jgi:hypothetical protein